MRSKNSGENETKQNTFVHGLAGTRRTRVQTVRIYLLKTAWTFGLLCGNTCILRSYVVITLFQYGINFRRQLWLGIGPAQSDLRILAWNVLQTCLGVPAIGLEK